jgi:hypothetical protein
LFFARFTQDKEFHCLEEAMQLACSAFGQLIKTDWLLMGEAETLYTHVS